MTKAEEIFLQHRPLFCEKCGGKMFYQGSGLYQCRDCGAEQMDDFGKIKAFLDANGPTPAVTIAKATGVDRETINYYLRRGRVEIPEGSKFYLKCEKCGCSIRYGRYCPECVKNAADKRGVLLTEEMGERPRGFR